MSPRRFVRGALALSALLTIGAASCSGAAPISSVSCPPSGTTLTYENFGQAFFDDHCVRCHGGSGGYSSRSFTTVSSIRDQKDRIFINAAEDNDSMPPGPDGPGHDARHKLAEWLACGAP